MTSSDKKLNERQMAFVRELLKFSVEDGKYVPTTYEAAAKAAGYAVSSAKQIGSKLAQDPRVVAELDRLRKQAEQDAIIDRNKVIGLVMDAVNKALKGYPMVDKDGNTVAIRIEPCTPQLLDVLCKCTGSYAEEKISHSVSASGEKFGIILNLEGKKNEDI